MEPDFGNLQFNSTQKTDLTAREIAKGQKAVIYAVLLNFLVVGILVALASAGLTQDTGRIVIVVSWLLRLAAVVMGIVGVLKIGSELGWSAVANVFIFVLLLIPLVNLLTLLVVNGKATAYLKKAGYKVGLVGAYK